MIGIVGTAEVAGGAALLVTCAAIMAGALEVTQVLVSLGNIVKCIEEFSTYPSYGVVEVAANSGAHYAPTLIINGAWEEGYMVPSINVSGQIIYAVTAAPAGSPFNGIHSFYEGIDTVLVNVDNIVAHTNLSDAGTLAYAVGGPFVGASSTTAYLYRAGISTPLGSLGPSPSSGHDVVYPTGINSLGDVVGFATYGGSTTSAAGQVNELRPFFYSAGQINDYSSQIPGDAGVKNLCINDAGQISGITSTFTNSGVGGSPPTQIDTLFLLDAGGFTTILSGSPESGVDFYSAPELNQNGEVLFSNCSDGGSNYFGIDPNGNVRAFIWKAGTTTEVAPTPPEAQDNSPSNPPEIGNMSVGFNNHDDVIGLTDSGDYFGMVCRAGSWGRLDALIDWTTEVPEPPVYDYKTPLVTPFAINDAGQIVALVGGNLDTSLLVRLDPKA